MGIGGYLKKKGSGRGGKALMLEDDGTVVRVMYDASDDDLIKESHKHVQGRAKISCAGDDCIMCAMGAMAAPLKTTRRMAIQVLDLNTEKWSDATLFLGWFDLERLAAVEPEGARRVVIDVSYGQLPDSEYKGKSFTLVSYEDDAGAVLDGDGTKVAKRAGVFPPSD